MRDNNWKRGLACSALALALAACSSGDDDSMMNGIGAGGQPGAGLPVGGAAAAGGIGGAAPTTTGGSGGGIAPGMGGVGGIGISGAGGTGTGGAAAGGARGAMAGGGSGGMAMMGGSGGMTSMAGSGGAGTSDAGTDAAMGNDNSAQTLPPITDYTQDGPFATKVESDTGPSSNYTIYRPDPLGKDGFLHSPIIFGPGIATSCAPGGLLNVYTTLLNHLASHGFVTICVNSLGGGPNDPGNLDAMKTGLDWLIAQNTESGSEFEGKLAVDRAVTMGYSIGATASTQLSSHPAIMTTVSIHGHNTSGEPHGPIVLLTGTSDVIDDNRATLKTLDEAPAILAALPIGHLDVPTEISQGGRYIAPITAWLRYWVNGDDNAKHFFWGDSCDMCSSPWITPETNAAWDAQNL